MIGLGSDKNVHLLCHQIHLEDRINLLLVALVFHDRLVNQSST